MFLNNFLFPVSFFLPLVRAEICYVDETVPINKTLNKFVSSYRVVNCPEKSCCTEGCCTLVWYTGPLTIFVLIILVCLITCLKAAWDVYQENKNIGNTVINNRDISLEVIPSPPPSYNVAIFLPQPPTYEEVMRSNEGLLVN